MSSNVYRKKYIHFDGVYLWNGRCSFWRIFIHSTTVQKNNKQHTERARAKKEFEMKRKNQSTNGAIRIDCMVNSALRHKNDRPTENDANKSIESQRRVWSWLAHSLDLQQSAVIIMLIYQISNSKITHSGTHTTAEWFTNIQPVNEKHANRHISISILTKLNGITHHNKTTAKLFLAEKKRQSIDRS